MRVRMRKARRIRRLPAVFPVVAAIGLVVPASMNAAFASAPVMTGGPVVASVPAGRAMVADARPNWAMSSADRGGVAVSGQLDLRVYLAGRDPQGLAAFDRAVSDPHSPSFRHYLTPQQVQARFGPTTAQINAIRTWLASAGLVVTGVNQHYVSVHGTVASAQQAFGVALHDYAVQGGLHRAPSGVVSTPASVAGAVLGVTGLDDGLPRAHPADTLPGPEPVTLRADPCSTYFGQNQAVAEPFTYSHVGVWTECGMTPQQVRSVYGADSSGLTGSGVTVAVMDAYASPTIGSDVSTYAAAHGSAGFRAGQFTQSLPAAYNDVSGCGGNLWYSEESLDVEAVHNVAPDANVVYVGAASCHDSDLTDALSRIVDNHLADIVSNSWGDGAESDDTPAQKAAFDQVFQQAAAEGIGMYFASGDCGAEDPASSCNSGNTKAQPDFPPADPWVTAVGGTSLAINSNGKELFQSGWGNILSTPNSNNSGWTPAPGSGYPAAFDAGSGGGTSPDIPQPSYQKNVVPTALATTLLDGTTTPGPMRVVPDVAAVADNNTGMLVGQTQLYPDGSVRYHETRWGGTSLSSPIFAGMQALAQQAQGAPIGFANPAIYARYGTPAFEDVTDTPFGPNVQFGVVRNNYTNSHDPNSPITTRLDTFAHDGLLHATPGYDDVTGVGAPSPTGYLNSYRR
ncbi:subtilase family serine protease [Catenulispora sp. GAS73]|uniref:S53 family peptidase n=1 Tax=Catenulispora sp. GAS73 TaxID=3156269 RepID=UPI0035129E16